MVYSPTDKEMKKNTTEEGKQAKRNTMLIKMYFSLITAYMLNGHRIAV